MVASDSDAVQEHTAIAAAAAAASAVTEPAKMNVWEARKKEQESRASSAGNLAVGKVVTPDNVIRLSPIV